MAILLLMRHAKSSWADQVQGDRQRPLNARGRSDAPVMARWLAQEGLIPDGVVTSNAARAVETWECMAPTFENARATLRPEIYLAGTEALLNVIRSTSEGTKTLLLIGHEPGISNAAIRLSRDPMPENIRQSLERFTTANIAVIKLNVPTWAEVGKDAGTCTRLIRPADLKSVARYSTVISS